MQGAAGSVGGRDKSVEVSDDEVWIPKTDEEGRCVFEVATGRNGRKNVMDTPDAGKRVWWSVTARKKNGCIVVKEV